ncbi:uncharacterized protein ACIBXB_008252 isoform 1-T1 [Morphnus guianensis]
MTICINSIREATFQDDPPRSARKSSGELEGGEMRKRIAPSCSCRCEAWRLKARSETDLGLRKTRCPKTGFLMGARASMAEQLSQRDLLCCRKVLPKTVTFLLLELRWSWEKEEDTFRSRKLAWRMPAEDVVHYYCFFDSPGGLNRVFLLCRPEVGLLEEYVASGQDSVLSVCIK